MAAGPWEKYAAEESNPKPWEKYAGTQPTKPAASVFTADPNKAIAAATGQPMPPTMFDKVVEQFPAVKEFLFTNPLQATGAKTATDIYDAVAGGVGDLAAKALGTPKGKLAADFPVIPFASELVRSVPEVVDFSMTPAGALAIAGGRVPALRPAIGATFSTDMARQLPEAVQVAAENPTPKSAADVVKLGAFTAAPVLHARADGKAEAVKREQKIKLSPETPEQRAATTAALATNEDLAIARTDPAQASKLVNQEIARRQAAGQWDAALEQTPSPAEARARKKAARVVVPSEGDTNPARTYQRANVARETTGKAYEALTPEERVAVDDLVKQGYGFREARPVNPDDPQLSGGTVPPKSRTRTEQTQQTRIGADSQLSESNTSGIPQVDNNPASQTARQPTGQVVYGRETDVRVPGERTKYKSVYAVREAEDVVASHNAENFEPNPEYQFKNDRNYSDPQNAERIVKQTAEFDPGFLINDNPDATNGPPIVDASGNVLGGNSRTMTMSRVRAQRPEAMAEYRAQLEKQAKAFGLDPELVRRTKNPVLVRQVAETNFDPQRAITDFNKVGTAELKVAERAVADSRRIGQETLDLIQRRIEDQGAEGTLSQALERGDNRELLGRLRDDGIITQGEMPKLLNSDGSLTADGKGRVSRLLIGRLFEDARQLEDAAPELKQKLERVVAPLSRLAGREEWDITQDVKDAVRLVEESRSREVTINDLVKQQGLFGDSGWSDNAIAIAEVLRNEKPTEVTRRFRQYAAEADLGASGQGLLVLEAPTPAESFLEAFVADKPPTILQRIDANGKKASERLRSRLSATSSANEFLNPETIRDMALSIAGDVARGTLKLADLGKRLSAEYGPKARVIAQKVWAEAQRIVAETTRRRENEQAVTKRFASWVSEDPERAVEEYVRRNTKDGTLTINTDLARELSPDYAENRESRLKYTGAVQEPSSALVRRVLDEALAKPPAEGEAVTITAGGPGSGKSAATSGGVPTPILIDAVMSSRVSAERAIERVLASGRDVEYIHVLRSTKEAFINGVLPRAMRDGRTMPLDYFLDAHSGAVDATLWVSEKYKGDPRVTVRVLDNRRSEGEAKYVPVAILRGQRNTGHRSVYERELQRARESGIIDDDVYRRFSETEKRSNRATASEQPSEIGRGKNVSPRRRENERGSIVIGPGEPKPAEAPAAPPKKTKRTAVAAPPADGAIPVSPSYEKTKGKILDKANVSEETRAQLATEMEKWDAANPERRKITHAELDAEARSKDPILLADMDRAAAQQAAIADPALFHAARQLVNTLGDQARELGEQIRTATRDTDTLELERKRDLIERDIQNLLGVTTAVRSQHGRNLAMHRMMVDKLGFDVTYWAGRAKKSLGLPADASLPVDVQKELGGILAEGRKAEADALTKLREKDAAIERAKAAGPQVAKRKRNLPRVDAEGNPIAPKAAPEAKPVDTTTPPTAAERKAMDADAKVQEKRRELARKMAKLEKATLLETISAIRRAGLLTSLRTAARNVGGNMTMQILEETSRVPGAMVDVGLSLFTDRRTVEGLSTRAVARATYEAATKGAREATEIMRRGATDEQLAQFDMPKELNIGGGRASRVLEIYVNGVFRLMSAQDRVFKRYAIERSLQEQIKLSGADAPTEAMMAQAIADADFATFNNKNKLHDMYSRARSGASPGVRFALDMTLPFVRTPMNVLARVIDYSGGGLAKGAAAGIKAAIDKSLTAEQQRYISQNLGRGITGPALIYMGYQLAANGLATGTYQPEPGKRNTDEAAGRLNGAVKIGDTWQQVSPLSPGGALITIGATLHRESTGPLRDEAKRPGKVLAVAGRTILDHPFLQGAKEIVDTAGDPANRGERVATSIAGSFVPSAVSDVASLADDVRRDTRTDGGFVDSVAAAIAVRTPGARNTLPERKDVLGRKLPQTKTAVVNPGIGSQAKEDSDPIVRELVRNKVSVGDPQRHAGESLDEYRMRRELIGREIEKQLGGLVNSREYAGLATEEERRNALDKAETRARRLANAKLGRDFAKLSPAQRLRALNQLLGR